MREKGGIGAKVKSSGALEERRLQERTKGRKRDRERPMSLELLTGRLGFLDALEEQDVRFGRVALSTEGTQIVSTRDWHEDPAHESAPHSSTTRGSDGCRGRAIRPPRRRGLSAST